MNRTLALSLILVAAVVIAASTLFAPAQRSAQSAQLGPVLPELAATLNDQKSITLSDIENTVSFARKDGQWVFKDLPGLPVKQGKVRELLLDILSAKLVEAKTDDPQFHNAIGLGSGGTRIELGDGTGFIIGKEAAGAGVFVRRLDGDQSYVAKQVPTPQVQVKAWADITVPVVQRDLISRVDVNDGAEPYSVVVSGDTQILETLESDEALAYDGVLDTVVAGAVYVDFEDAALADSFDWEGAGKTVFTGPEDTDTLTYWLLDEGGSVWLRTQPQGVFLPEGDIDWQRWAFQISDYRKDTLLKPRKDLLKAGDGGDDGADEPGP